MEIPMQYRGRSFYHFTHIDNIESIITEGLLATNEKKRKGIQHRNLANENIQLRRSKKDVPCSPGGKIHDYVPFYFTAPNPMLLSVVNRKNIDQPLVVYIAISIDKLKEDSVLFTDRAANTEILPNFYNDPKDLVNLNWNLIEHRTWSEKDNNDLHYRMAEVFIHKGVPSDWIESFIVYNKICKEKIEEIYKRYGLPKPKISYVPYKGKFFYFTKFFIKNQENNSLITGPVFMKRYYEESVEIIIKEREKGNNNKIFLNINDALMKIEGDFCVIKELQDIYELKTDNPVHKETVSDHTLNVVANLQGNKYYEQLSSADKSVVKLSAYLHDIGKGPKSKWSDGIQHSYPDHPADSVPMIRRILIDEFVTVSEDEIKKICLLVFYHDLIGDIINNGRSKEELLNLNLDENELNMLIAITIADVSAINFMWTYELKLRIPQLKEDILNDATICIR